MSSWLRHLLALVAFMISAASAAENELPGAGTAPGEPAQGTDRDGDPLPRGAITRLGALRLQHGGSISNLLFTRDGKGLISAGGEPIIRLWDPSTGQEIRRFAGHEAAVYSIALSPDGKMLASGGEDQTIRLWDVASGRELMHWSVAEDARLPVAFSPSGKVLASGGEGNSIVLWNVDTGKELRRFKGRERGWRERWGQPEGGLLFSVAFTPDGRYLLTTQSDGLILCDLNTGKRLRKYEANLGGGWSIGGPGGSVTSADVSKRISFSADGETFVLAGDQNGPISIWELNSVEERGRLEGHESVVLAARFAPDGKMLASAAHDGTLRIWDAVALKALHTFNIGRELVSDLAISPDGQTIALGSPRGRIRFWDLKTGKERAAGERPEPAVAIGFSADGRSVVSLDTRSIRQWDVTTGKELRKTKLAEEKEPALLRLSADGRLLVQARPGQPIRLLDATTGKELRVLEGKHEQVFQLALAPDGLTLTAATMDGDSDGSEAGTLRVWDAKTGKELHQLPAGPAAMTALTLSPDGRTVAGAEANGGFRLWELSTGKVRCRLAVPSRPRVSSDEYMEMRLGMRMRGRREEEGPERASPLVFTPDGKGLAVGEGETIRVWDLASGKIVRRFACDASVSGEFAFSPDSQLLAARGPDNTIWIWNNASSQMLARLKGHRGPVHRLAFSPDSKALVSASEDGTAVIWDVRQAIAPSRIQPRVDPSEQLLAALWADLADADAARAYRAILKLVEAPKPAVRLIGDRLRPASAADPRRIARLIAVLDAEEFQVRENAAGELEQLHELAAPALEKALAAKPPLEARRRLEKLMEKVQRRQLPAGTVRALRAVEVLEAIDTPEARKQLEALAGGAPEARLTKEAKVALQRLRKQTDSQARPEKDEALGKRGHF